jgi:hypothetical protein
VMMRSMNVVKDALFLSATSRIFSSASDVFIFLANV